MKWEKVHRKYEQYRRWVVTNITIRQRQGCKECGGEINKEIALRTESLSLIAAGLATKIRLTSSMLPFIAKLRMPCE
jgi:hypothetical protein